MPTEKKPESTRHFCDPPPWKSPLSDCRGPRRPRRNRKRGRTGGRAPNPSPERRCGTVAVAEFDPCADRRAVRSDSAAGAGKSSSSHRPFMGRMAGRVRGGTMPGTDSAPDPDRVPTPAEKRRDGGRSSGTSPAGQPHPLSDAQRPLALDPGRGTGQNFPRTGAALRQGGSL